MQPEKPASEALYGPADFARDTGANTRQLADLTNFLGELERWNSQMNLVGPSALPVFWKRHALDSAQLLHVEHSAVTWADVGAGAGFPGIVLAILLKGRPGATVHLIESMAKRVRFLDAVASNLDLPVILHHGRAESIAPPAQLEIVTARACAPLPKLFSYVQKLFHPGARGLFLKGRDVQSELTEARRTWTFDSHLIQSASDPSGFVVRIERLASRGR